MPVLIALALIAIALFIWWRYFHVARPVIPPLVLPDNDPLMLAATEQARATLNELRELAAAPNRGVHVKVPFVSSAGTTEFLWADLLSLESSSMKVRYITPPVTHRGRLERVHAHPLSDLVDWRVELPSGAYAGGFTMRAMFVRAREQMKDLPPELEEEEHKYGRQGFGTSD